MPSLGSFWSPSESRDIWLFIAGISEIVTETIYPSIFNVLEKAVLEFEFCWLYSTAA